jgi:hypothetical protein
VYSVVALQEISTSMSAGVSILQLPEIEEKKQEKG